MALTPGREPDPRKLAAPTHVVPHHDQREELFASPWPAPELESLIAPIHKRGEAAISKVAPDAPQESPTSRPPTITSVIMSSPTTYWGTGNVFASIGVSWIGIIGNVVTTAIGLVNAVRDSRSTQSLLETELPPQRGLVREWISSPAIFPVVDTMVVAAASIEAYANNFHARSAAFALYAVGGLGAIYDIAGDYFAKRGIGAPLGMPLQKLWSAIPKEVKAIVLCTGLWWCGGDIVMGLSEMSLEQVTSSWGAGLGTFGALAGAAAGCVLGLKAAFQGFKSRAALWCGAVSYGFFALANGSTGGALLAAGFACWAVCAAQLARMAKPTPG